MGTYKDIYNTDMVYVALLLGSQGRGKGGGGVWWGVIQGGVYKVFGSPVLTQLKGFSLS